jgi:hypothetical protein
MFANCFIITNNMQIKVAIKGRTVLCRRQTDIDSERELWCPCWTDRHGWMGIVNRSCDVHVGQAGPRRFSRDKVDRGEGWLSEIRTAKIKFKSVYGGRMECIYDALELDEAVLLESWAVFKSLENNFVEEEYSFNMNYCFVLSVFSFHHLLFSFPLIWDLELL